MVALRSTSVVDAEFIPDTRDETVGELTITFVNGQSYTYSDVPTSIYEGLIGSSSPGSYFHAVIKDAYG